MPKPRKIRVVDDENQAPKVANKKTNSKVSPAKKQKREPEWTNGNGGVVVKLILSILKSDINNVKVITELTKLYKSVSSEFLDVS